MGFAYHQINLYIPQAAAVVNNIWALFNANATGQVASGVVIISSLAPSSAMLKVAVEVLVFWVLLMFGLPDPLIEGVMAYTIDTLNLPPAADQLRAEFFLL